MDNQLSRTFLWPSLSLLSLPTKIGHEAMWTDSCQRFHVWWLRLTSTRFGGLYYDEHNLAYLGEWNGVCLCLWISLCVHTTLSRLKHVQFLNELELLFCSIRSFPCCYSWVQICQCLVFPSPRWVRSQWHNHLGSTKKRKRKHGTRNNTKEKGRDKLMEEEMTRINLMMLGPESSTYPPLSLSFYIFCVCPWKWRGQKDSFCVTALLPYSLDSVYVPQSALCVIYSHTYKSQGHMPLHTLSPHSTSQAEAATYRSHSILCGHVFDLGMPFYILDVK